MIEAEAKSVVWPHVETISRVIEQINCATTPREIAQALARSPVSEFVPWDNCCLILPSQERGGREHVRRAWCVERAASDAYPSTFDGADSPFAQMLEGGAPVLLDETVLRGAPEEIVRGLRSALALPLSSGGHPVGALCFLSASPETYADLDARKLSWLSSTVAAAVQAAMCGEQLENAKETSRELERLRSGFVNTLVRDVRIPLTNVLGLLELFDSKLQAREPFDLEDRQLLGGVIEQGDRMRHLVDDLVEVSRQHERPLSLDLEQIEALSLVESAVEPLRGEAALRGVALQVQHAGSVPLLQVDVRQARRALCHVVGVALAATRDGGRIQIEAQSITGTRVGDSGRRFVIVNVTDSGEGIPPEEIPFVFDALWNVSSPDGGAGRGLGLAIAKRIAASHGGNVSVRSQLGAGTTYSILLPAADGQEDAADARRILVVDDAPELQLLLAKLLTRMGYQDVTAPGATRAIEILREQQVDLLVTDWAMPEANGGELIATLKRDERWRDIPTIVLTGHDTDNERREAERVGCDRFLVKPVMRDELHRVISELVTA
jgi:signal transduction histidine kinase